jgi:hypothetical protein
MLRRHEQYRYTLPIQVWDDLRKLDVWNMDEPESRRSRETAPLPPAIVEAEAVLTVDTPAPSPVAPPRPVAVPRPEKKA